LSIATENFIKAIYQFGKTQGLDTKPSSIAKKLNISSAAATDMAKKLADKKLVNYQKYKSLLLTKKGEELAVQILRKHRIWETFLFKHLNLSLHEIHREAELLEHQTSDFLADKIHEHLGFPNFDPHGDPIPSKNGEIIDIPSISLSNAIEGKLYKVVRLQSDKKDFFDFCVDNQLLNGQIIKVQKQMESTRMTQIEVEGTKLLLNKEFTNIINVSEYEVE